MKKLILLLLFVVAACGTQMIDPPERLIEKDKFVNILFDLTLYNGIFLSISKKSQRHR